MSYKEWPEDNEPAAFEQISGPIVRALADLIGNKMVQVAKVKRRTSNGLSGYKFGAATSAIKTIDYDGYNIGRSEQATCGNAADQLEETQLQWQWTDQGRTPVEVIVTLAIQLGIEQGRRIAAREAERSGPAFKLKLIKSLLDD